MVRLSTCLALAVAGCTASSEQVQPPEDQFYFPNGLAVSPGEDFLFVSNGNADLRYDSGTVAVVELDRVEAISRAWVDDGAQSAGCAPHDALRQTLVCDEAEVLISGSAVRVGSFAGVVSVQALDDGRQRLFLPVRGDPSLTWIDFDPDTRTLDCGGSGDYPRCDDAHRLIRLFNDLESPGLVDEPFGLFVDGANGYALMTHLTTGIVTVASTPPDGTAPVLTDARGGFFTRSATTGALGAVGVAGRQPGSPDDLIYVTSRSDSRVQTLTVVRPDGATPRIAPADFFYLNALAPFVSSPAPYDDARDVVFRADGARAYVVNRKPPALIAIDTSLGSTGRPRNEVLGAVELCAQPAVATLVDVGRGQRAYVSCFRNGQVWVVDPDELALEAVIDVGRGPSTLAAAPGRRQLYVSNFLEDSVAVIDLTPCAPTEHQVVVRLGTSRQEGSD